MTCAETERRLWPTTPSFFEAGPIGHPPKFPRKNARSRPMGRNRKRKAEYVAHFATWCRQKACRLRAVSRANSSCSEEVLATTSPDQVRRGALRRAGRRLRLRKRSRHPHRRLSVASAASGSSTSTAKASRACRSSASVASGRSRSFLSHRTAARSAFSGSRSSSSGSTRAASTSPSTATSRSTTEGLENVQVAPEG